MACLFSSPWPRSTFCPKPPDVDTYMHLSLYLINQGRFLLTNIPIERGRREQSIDTIKKGGESLYDEIFASKGHFRAYRDLTSLSNAILYFIANTNDIAIISNGIRINHFDEGVKNAFGKIISINFHSIQIYSNSFFVKELTFVGCNQIHTRKCCSQIENGSLYIKLPIC